MVLQDLHQARFANARLATQEHDLSDPLLDLRPALDKEPDFLPPADQRGPLATDGFQATTGQFSSMTR